MPQIRCILTLLILCVLCRYSSPAQSAPTHIWTPFETTLEATRSYTNPLLDLEVEVEFTAPSGATTTVLAFWDYGRTWKARFMPDEVGRWRYVWRSADTSDPKLNGASGAFESIPYSGNNPLYLHGNISVASVGRHFSHADGNPFFWLGDTAWNGALLADRAEWDTYLDDRAAKHFSVIQFVISQWRSAAGDENGRPAFIVRRGKVEVDPIFFQRLDERVAAVNAHGLLAAPVMFWTNPSHPELNPGLFLTAKQIIALGRYMVARYGAHHVTWILGGDGYYDEKNIDKWQRVGRALFSDGAPGIEHPVTMHATYWCANAFGDEDWWDYNGYQSGHERLRGLERITQGEPTEFWRRDPKRPILNLEPNYEAHRNRAPGAGDVFTDIDVRRAAWLSMLNTPPAGMTYGGHGIWGWHPRALEPMTHQGTGIGPAWFDAIDLPGSTQLKHMAEFFVSIDWTSLRPAQDLLSVQPGSNNVLQWVGVARADSGPVVAYSAAGAPIEFKSAPGSTATWISPRTGEHQPAVASGTTFAPPTRTDWALLISQ
jgi:uncharacterized protein DUF4038/uncharacterized protein DUF5060